MRILLATALLCHLFVGHTFHNVKATTKRAVAVHATPSEITEAFRRSA